METEDVQFLAKNRDDDGSDEIMTDIPTTVDGSKWAETKSLVAGAVGNLLEWFDFAIFGLLAHEIGVNFFPETGSRTIHLLEAFGTFAGAFFMRPLGGALFGYIGDKYSRLTSLRLSIFLMAIPTFLTGLLPTFASIGIASTILLVFFRLLQGVSVGGELTGALVYIMEIAPKKKRALYLTLVQVSGSGTLLASIVEYFMRMSMTDYQILNFGWRIPFLFGIIVAAFGVFIRKGLKTSKEFEEIKQSGQIEHNPFWATLKTNKVVISQLILHYSYAAASWYTVGIWIPTYLIHIRQPPLLGAFGANSIAIIVDIIFSIFSGVLADIWSINKVLLVFGPLSMISYLLLFPLYGTLSIGWTTLISVYLMSIRGLYYGAVNVFGLLLLKDPKTRTSGLGLGYNISLALFGGTSPMVATALTESYGLYAHGIYLASLGLISLLVDIYAIKTEKKQQQNDIIQMVNNNSNESNQI